MDLDFVAAKGFFVTATDTGVGKTLVSGTLVHQLINSGKKAGVFKPVASGCSVEGGAYLSEDAEFLHKCCPWLSEELICPCRFEPPVAPMAAEMLTGKLVNWKAISGAYSQIVEKSDLVVVEGVGGIMVPLSKDILVIDLVAAMKLPVVIVAHNSLGTISHTISTIKMCRNHNIDIAAVIMNQNQPCVNPQASKTNAHIIQQVTGQPILQTIPYDSSYKIDHLISSNNWENELPELHFSKIM